MAVETHAIISDGAGGFADAALTFDAMRAGKGAKNILIP